MENNFNEQELNRRNAVVQMRELGIEPYPAALYEVNAKAADIPAQFDPQSGEQWNVSIAGRIMSRRIMGAAAFIELLDDTGKIQIYIKRDEICEGEDKTLYNTVFKKLLDIGDIVGIKGRIEKKSYEKDGEVKSKINVVAEKVTFLSSKKADE